VKTGVQGIRNDLKALDSGPFDKPFENLRVLSNVEGLRVPSLSRDFRRNDRKHIFSAFYRENTFVGAGFMPARERT
jgi:hypothetical protein